MAAIMYPQALFRTPDGSAASGNFFPGMGFPVPIEVHADLSHLGEQISSPKLAAPATAIVGKDSMHIEMDIKLPQPGDSKKKEKKKPKVVKKTQASNLSGILKQQRFPEPVYFQSFDCVGVPGFFSSDECKKIIKAAEDQGFVQQRRHRVLNYQYSDIIDSFFAEAVWKLCGLGFFLQKILVDGMAPYGLNDVIRVHKYEKGQLFGRHTDQHVRRIDGKMSKYTLRVYLNALEDGAYKGGLSAFHVPFRPEPVVFEPEEGLALLYPQGEHCTVQEEKEVESGKKYVFRADILFAHPELPTR